ncbi:MAG: aminoglycoside phosphotransferase [Deltaproteobacteria bacterium]|nr:MAG: aminoglycoside phosphotransferase [Deltaproteobacteria bacterium]
MAIAHLPPLISVLTETDFYPHHPSQVELRQTHISYVFLAGEYVYKVKKPVRFAFLDYSTLEKRFHFCQEEVRLNRRLAPKIYLGVVPVYRSGERFVLGDGPLLPDNSTLAEHAVKMRRLPEDRMLNRLLVERTVTKDDIRAIVKKLVSFHLSAATERASIYGAPEAIRRQVTDNFEETRQFIGQTISEKLFNRIRQDSLGFLRQHGELFKARVQEDRVREGHGDLRAESICLTDEITVFDCIEFDERLRYCDVASEIAFLAMDLDFLDASDFSEHLTAEYTTTAQDEALPLLLPFYKCYRAYVRGKVESLKGQEQEVPQLERERALARAQRYFRLAYRYFRGPRKAAMLIICGLVATGKSTVARMLGDLTGFQVLSSDVVRKGLARVSPTERAAEGYRKGIYSDPFTRLTYETLLEKAERRLEAGKGVIVDATFSDMEHRRLFLSLAAHMGAPIFFIECRAQEEEIFRRLKEREQRVDEISDATWQIYLRQRDEFAPLTEIPDRIHLTVNTETNPRDAIEKLVESL